MSFALATTLLASLLIAAAEAVSITDIQGVSFQSPYAGLFVDDIVGIVSAKDRYGFWLSGEPAEDLRASHGIRVYGRNIANSVTIGDMVSLSGKVTEYRNPSRQDDLFLTEIEQPTHIRVISSDKLLSPVVLGEDRIPPTGAYTPLDIGPDGWLSVPNNLTLNEAANATLQPDKYGLDFWESLEGQLVTIKSPVAASFPDRFGSFWVYGTWPVSGKNSRGGLSLAFGSDSLPYAHSEAILIGHPLDSTRNPRVSVGVALSDITGVLTYQYGFYTILPLTTSSIVSVPQTKVTPAPIPSSGDPCELSIGDYNVENMAPRSRHIPRIADHIANHLNAPDIVFVQEIQDDSGSRDDGTVSANRTLSALVKAIAEAGDGVHYEFVNIPPIDNMDGGKPGSNIRVAYLYARLSTPSVIRANPANMVIRWRPEKVSLLPGSPIGTAIQGTEAILDKHGYITLSLNPGRIEPWSFAWEETRKPLAAAWQTTTGERFFTVNVHFSSKRDSSSAHGDARPPVNGHSERRTQQVNVTASFIESILAKDANASIILAGDMNEFVQTRSVFRPLSGLLTDINELSGVDPVERYTYVYDQRSQEIDHIFVSDAIGRRGTEVEHVHVNTWAASVSERASDHDPTVAKVRVCDSATVQGDVELQDPALLVQDTTTQIPL
ncbi:hypothetical protein NM688_g6078 [Phlebia brevispora]|uniref:Uncharacterized protein n=1 Tax=Phlebia brevispora TaxID=194682 RepID=A0ACC1SKJ3_9APHY|nr:hypothetical protein NM688_g6078 [Phlebia brevispora]